MKQTIAAVFLAGFATISLAQGDKDPSYLDMPIVKDAQSCPAGFVPTVPSYKLENGHLVNNGWECESLSRDPA